MVGSITFAALILAAMVGMDFRYGLTVKHMVETNPI